MRFLTACLTPSIFFLQTEHHYHSQALSPTQFFEIIIHMIHITVQDEMLERMRCFPPAPINLKHFSILESAPCSFTISTTRKACQLVTAKVSSPLIPQTMTSDAFSCGFNEQMTPFQNILHAWMKISLLFN